MNDPLFPESISARDIQDAEAAFGCGVEALAEYGRFTIAAVESPYGAGPDAETAAIRAAEIAINDAEFFFRVAGHVFAQDDEQVALFGPIVTPDVVRLDFGAEDPREEDEGCSGS